MEYAANKPIEDRHHMKQLENLDGYVVSVYDGHGGWQVGMINLNNWWANVQIIIKAELAMNHLSEELDNLLKANKDKYKDVDECVTQSLKQAFDKVVS